MDELISRAGRIVHGRCVDASVASAQIAGATIRVTDYTFEIIEDLKTGAAGGTMTFRQAGTPERGPLDLGRLAGLPVYHPNREYVLMLLPESRAGLTSPAGAGDGAFEVSGDELVPLRTRVKGAFTSGEQASSSHRPANAIRLRELRAAVRWEVRR